MKKAASPPIIDPPSKTPSDMKKLLINAGTKASFMYHHPFGFIFFYSIYMGSTEVI
ncbi:hypothetical protein [Peribacillus butanolivorans]|uniref:hypothetical protein n=1 Tax=Peribacillus butanolivorans TaxID=421767 RepID=UPI00366FCDD4